MKADLASLGNLKQRHNSVTTFVDYKVKNVPQFLDPSMNESYQDFMRVHSSLTFGDWVLHSKLVCYCG